MGGTVEVKVGDDLCKVESMTETEIKCRTVGGPEEPPTYVSTKKFTTLDLSTSHYHRVHYDLEDVKTYEECEGYLKIFLLYSNDKYFHSRMSGRRYL